MTARQPGNSSFASNACTHLRRVQLPGIDREFPFPMLDERFDFERLMFSQSEFESGCENFALVNEDFDDGMIDKDTQFDRVGLFDELHRQTILVKASLFA